MQRMVLKIGGENWYTMREGAEEVGVSETTFRTARRRYEKDTGIAVEKKQGNTQYITETDLNEIIKRYFEVRAAEKGLL